MAKESRKYFNSMKNNILLKNLREEKIGSLQHSGSRLEHDINEENNSSIHVREKPFKCSICTNKYTQKAGLVHHIASIHEGKKPFACDLCDMKFTAKANIKIHKENIHEGKKPFKCRVCDADFPKKFKLNYHIASVHEERRPFTV